MAFPIAVLLAVSCFSLAGARNYDEFPQGRFWSNDFSNTNRRDSAPRIPFPNYASPPLSSDYVAPRTQQMYVPYSPPTAPLNAQPQAQPPYWTIPASPYAGAAAQAASLSVFPGMSSQMAQAPMAQPQRQSPVWALTPSSTETEPSSWANPRVQPLPQQLPQRAQPQVQHMAWSANPPSVGVSSFDHSIVDPAMTSDGLDSAPLHPPVANKMSELDHSIVDPAMEADGIMGSQESSIALDGKSDVAESFSGPQNSGSQADPVMTHLGEVVRGLQALHNREKSDEEMPAENRLPASAPVTPPARRLSSLWTPQSAKTSASTSVLGAPLTLEPMGPPSVMPPPDAQLPKGFEPNVVRSPSNMHISGYPQQLAQPSLSGFALGAPLTLEPMGPSSVMPQPGAPLLRGSSPTFDAVRSAPDMLITDHGFISQPVRAAQNGFHEASPIPSLGTNAPAAPQAMTASSPGLASSPPLKTEGPLNMPLTASSSEAAFPMPSTHAASSLVSPPVARSVAAGTPAHSIASGRAPDHAHLPSAPKAVPRSDAVGAITQASNKQLSPFQHLEEMYNAAEMEIAELKKQQQTNKTSMVDDASNAQAARKAEVAVDSHPVAHFLARKSAALASPLHEAEAAVAAAVEAARAVPTLAGQHVLRDAAARSTASSSKSERPSTAPAAAIDPCIRSKAKNEDRVLLAALQGDDMIDPCSATPTSSNAQISHVAPATPSQSPVMIADGGVAAPLAQQRVSHAAQAVADMLHQLSGEKDSSSQDSKQRTQKISKTVSGPDHSSDVVGADASLLQQFNGGE